MDKPSNFIRVALALSCWTLLIPATAWPQAVAPPAPSGGLFGATRSDAGRRDKLNFWFDASEALSSELPPEFDSRVAVNDPRSGGASATLIAATDYAQAHGRARFAAKGFSAFRYYSRLGEVAAVSHSAELDATVRLPKQGTLQLDQTAAYAPAYLYQLVPTADVVGLDESIQTNSQYRIDPTDTYAYVTKITAAVGSPRRTQVTTTAEHNYTHSARELVQRPDLRVYSIGSKISRALSTRTHFSAGYEYRTGEFGYGGLTREHRFPISAQYARPLSVTRHLTFRLELTPATVSLPRAALLNIVPVDTPVDSRMERLETEGEVIYEFLPRWRASGRFRRGMEYLAVLTEPVFSDAARVELSGIVRRRVDIAAAAGYAVGASALQPTSQTLKTLTGSVRVRYAFDRSWAAYSEYVYYNFDLREQARLAPWLPQTFEQHMIRAGIMLFVRTR